MFRATRLIMSTELTLFEKIIQGQIPCSKIYETENTFAFLDIGPINFGHSLVICKKPHKDMFEVPDDILAECVVSAKKVGQALKDALGCTGVNIFQNNGSDAGQLVFHYHIHVIPRYPNDGVKIGWKAKKYESNEAAAEFQSKIVAALKSESEPQPLETETSS